MRIETTFVCYICVGILFSTRFGLFSVNKPEFRGRYEIGPQHNRTYTKRVHQTCRLDNCTNSQHANKKYHRSNGTAKRALGNGWHICAHSTTFNFHNNAKVFIKDETTQHYCFCFGILFGFVLFKIRRNCVFFSLNVSYICGLCNRSTWRKHSIQHRVHIEETKKWNKKW